MAEGLSALVQELLSAEDSLQECCRRIEERFENVMPDERNVDQVGFAIQQQMNSAFLVLCGQAVATFLAPWIYLNVVLVYFSILCSSSLIIILWGSKNHFPTFYNSDSFALFSCARMLFKRLIESST
jgi:hypothetical protein